ncbi:MurR/RpiR family transcriptional regulator, partial [Bacillus haikouensis]|uniref:MurR/RpiR family transcriptional regulator n=1 Tax=Bacillus haikouensis TaxID=1510468 RepID=UPI001FE29ECD
MAPDQMAKLNGMKPTMLIEQHKHTFTKSENKIYEYIIDNTDKVIYHSLTELSEACEVAEATVLRFFRKLNFKGFQDFKFLLAQEISQAKQHNGEETFKEKIMNNIIQAITDSSELVQLEELKKAIDHIDQSNDVVIYGIGSSGIAGLDMQNRLMRIGKITTVITDAHTQIMRASSMNKNTVVIAISLTGSTKDIVDAIKTAKANQATIIALTAYVKSPLTRYSDVVLLSSAK